MEKIDRLKLFIRMHSSDVGLFIIRFTLSYVFIAHSANELAVVLPGGITSSFETMIFILGMIELVSSIMILTGFIVRSACYTLVALILYYAITSSNSMYNIIFATNNGYSLLVIGVCIGISLIGPGKIVLNRRYGHTARSLREDGVDKETEIMGT
jgi:uncharacterized membrane protein YphA (DoxX/SURF4 family)